MDIVDNIRCAVELILPVVAWLAGVFSHKKRAAADTMKEQGEHPNGILVQGEESPSNASLARSSAGGAWASYAEKQASLQGAAPGIVAQPAMAGIGASALVGAAPAGRPGMPRWLRDFGPGALGALLVTVAFALVLSFSGPVITEADRATMQALTFVELLCMPLSLVAGALIGVLASLLTKAIAKGLHVGERAQVVSSTIVAAVSGGVAGLLWDLLVVVGAFL